MDKYIQSNKEEVVANKIANAAWWLNNYNIYIWKGGEKNRKAFHEFNC